MLISPSPGLSLALANTRYWRGSATPTDELADAKALSEWLVRNGALEAKAARALANDALFVQAIEMRETLYRIFAALAAQATPKPRDVAALRSALAAAPSRNRLVQTKDGFAWQLEAPDAPDASGSAALLAPVLWSAADLLTGDAAKRLRLCSNDKCLYLFVDNSRSGARRWCDMKACGNRAKAHRHYLRSKAA
jgi:predicted RNA-binding Zn ribbon-like protein